MTDTELFVFYQNRFKPIYADLVAVTAEKSLIVDAQIEQAMSHLAVWKTNNDPATSEENLNSAYGHLVRACLDATKLYWLNRSTRVSALTNDQFVKNWCLNMGAGKLNELQTEADVAMKQARRADAATAGHNAEDILRLYELAIQKYEEILASVDVVKMDEIKNLKITHLVKSQLIGFILGIFASVLASFIYARVQPAQAASVPSVATHTTAN